MNTRNYTTKILVENSPKEVYEAINNVRGWWQGEIKGDSQKVNDEFTYEMLPYHISTQRVIELKPDQKVIWLVTESKLNFTKEPNEWANTKIVFEITKVKDKTQLTFTHEGLVPEIECFNDCSNGWSMLIHKSLASLITTGKGVKVF